MFAPIYVCSEHGETWNAETVEEVDTQNDEVYVWKACPKCFREVKPLLKDGHQVFHVLSEEEMFWEMQS